jgi:1-acyl-sn-glycerol-3-phosphate acyltransferase
MLVASTLTGSTVGPCPTRRDEAPVANPRRLRERRGWAFGFCVAVVEPLLLLVTRRRWRDGESIPAEGGCVLAVNHVSHLDPLTCAHFVYAWGRIPRFLAKAEVFEVPVLGRIVRSAGQIPVRRSSTDASASFTAAVAAVGRGDCVVVYPEGTITRDPDLWPMRGKTGAARIALSSRVPVVPVAQWGAQRILAPYAKRPHLFPRRTIAMSAGRPVPLDDLREQPLTPEVLREATDRIMDHVTRLLEEIRGEDAPGRRFDPRAAGLRETGNPYARARKSRERRRP